MCNIFLNKETPTAPVNTLNRWWLPHVVTATNTSSYAAARVEESQYKFLLCFGPAAPQMTPYIFSCVNPPEAKEGFFFKGKLPWIKQQWQNNMKAGKRLVLPQNKEVTLSSWWEKKPRRLLDYGERKAFVYVINSVAGEDWSSPPPTDGNHL